MDADGRGWTRILQEATEQTERQKDRGRKPKSRGGHKTTNGRKLTRIRGIRSRFDDGIDGGTRMTRDLQGGRGDLTVNQRRSSLVESHHTSKDPRRSNPSFCDRAERLWG